MEVDDFVKLILAISGSISMLVISIQLARFFGTMSDTLKKLQETIDNLNLLTSQAVEDYKYVREAIETFGRMINKIEIYFVDPVAVAVSFFKELLMNVPSMVGRGEDED